MTLTSTNTFLNKTRSVMIGAFVLMLLAFSFGWRVQPALANDPAISFSVRTLVNASVAFPTSIEFGPDNRLYVLEKSGEIKVFTVSRAANGTYTATNQEVIDLVTGIPNHNDLGQPMPDAGRQATGMTVVGTAASPIIYVTSSNPNRLLNDNAPVLPVDTNSGIISRITHNGTTWEKIDLVRGLPRSAEYHSTNGLQYDPVQNILYVTSGGHTNMGAPGSSLSFVPEYALSAAILTVDLNVIDALPIQDPTGANPYLYDLPTLDPNAANKPFGGNRGINQAIIVPGGPVQIFSPGWRNPYDVVLTQSGRIYSIDNGPNAGFGGFLQGEADYPGPNAGTCTNAANEAGSFTGWDNLHMVTPGFYAGHPNPTRGNINNTFDGRTPITVANPIECDFRWSGNGSNSPQDGALAIWGSSTNGMAEYTASNFDNRLKGNLLAASFNSTLQRIALNADGTQATEVVTFASQAGTPLNVTAQGDFDIFPGTVWSVSAYRNTVFIYEPADYGGIDPGECNPVFSYEVDSDGDGYSDADEMHPFNNTNPCNAASRPQDNDRHLGPKAGGFLLSDVIDPDDDSDGIIDELDPFQIDPNNGNNLPIFFDFDPGGPHFGKGLLGSGFTGLMINGVDNYLFMFEPENMTVGGIAKVFVIDDVPAGSAANNDQHYAFQVGANVNSSTGQFSVATRLGQPYFDGAAPVGNQSQGMYIGTGDQSNYMMLVINANGMQLVSETEGVVSTRTYSAPGALNSGYIDLLLTVDPANATVRPRYALDDGVYVELEANPIAITNSAIANLVQTDSGALAAGIIATSDGGPEFTAVWQSFSVTQDAPSELEFTETDLDFGAVQMGSSATRIVNLRNTGIASDPAIEVSEFNITGGVGFSIVSPAVPFMIQPQQVVPVELRFEPALVGKRNATVALSHDGDNAPTLSLQGLGYEVGEIVYRVNAGGAAVAQAPMDWSADVKAQGGSPYLASPNADSNAYTQNNLGANTTGVPNGVFTTERWDPPGGTEMRWAFPVDAGDYMVRLYFAEICPCVTTAGARIFNINIQGQLAFTNFDQFATAGRDAIRLSHPVTVTGAGQSIQVELLRVLQNPSIKGLEIIRLLTGGEGILAVAPTSADFGEQTVNAQSAPQTISIANTGSTTAVQITNLSFNGGQAGMFAHNFSSAVTVPPGQDATFDLSFTPTSEGQKNSTLVITHTGTASPLSVPVTGLGKTPSSPLGADVQTVNFGTRAVDNAYTSSVVLQNQGGTGDPAIQISNVQINGDDAAQFSTNFSAPLNINQGANALLDVTFNPISSGPKYASLVITHNGSNSPLTLNISAAGSIEGTPVFRVNAGGAAVTDGAGVMNWAADTTAAPSPYIVGATGTNNRSYSAAFNGTNALGVPNALFTSERWFPGNMVWRFPVDAGQYEVRLYFAEIFTNAQNVNARTTDILINGNTLVTNFDQFDFAQRNTGNGINASMRAFPVAMAANGNIEITLTKKLDNPAIKAIEILSVTPSFPNTVTTNVTGSLVNFGTRNLNSLGTTSVTLSNGGRAGDPSIEVFAVNLTGDNANHFGHKFNNMGGSGLAQGGGIVLAPQESYSFDVTFIRDTQGQSVAQMNILHSGDNSPLLLDLVGQAEPSNNPYIVTTDPINGAMNVSVIDGVGATLFIPGQGDGVDTNTLNASTLIMTNLSTGQVIEASYGTSGGADVINIQPRFPLANNTTYRLDYRVGIQTVSGVPFVRNPDYTPNPDPGPNVLYRMTFTTGNEPPPAGLPPAAFEQVATNSTNRLYFTVNIGPDERLYASAYGSLYHWDILPDGQLTKEYVINIGNVVPIGFDFDPRSTPTNPIIWVTTNYPGFENAPHFSGGLMRVEGANVGTPGEAWVYEQYVTGFPRSVRDHMLNSAVFGPDGGLYLNVGGISAMGDRDNAWGLQPETVLSASMVRVDIPLLEAYYAANGILKVHTGTSTGDPNNPVGNGLQNQYNFGLGDPELNTLYYNPQAPGAPITLYATGLRNAYDMLWHSNGHLYVPTNGSQGGARTPPTPGVLPNACKSRIDHHIFGQYTGPIVPGTIPPTQNDYLFRVVQGGYYGHPNPTRCEWVMNGGNPTAGPDPMQIGDHYPIGTMPDRNWRGYSYDFGPNKSPNGVIEYRSDTFGGVLKGKILVVRWSQRDDIIVLEPGTNNPDIVAEYELIPGFTGLGDPLDLIEDTRNGNIYVIEYNPGKITLLRPINGNQPNITANPNPTYFNAPIGQTSPAQTVTIVNTGSAPLEISSITTTGPFSLSSSYSTTVAPNNFTTVNVVFQPSTTGPQVGQLRIQSNVPNQPTHIVTLRGLGTASGEEGGEPSLQWILNTRTIPVNVGDDAPNTSIIHSTLFNVPYLGQEIPVQAFQKAAPGNVTLELLGVFTANPSGANPVVDVSWYERGDSANPHHLFDIVNGQNRTLTPAYTGALSFDPGLAEFGFATRWPQYGYTVYTERVLNTFTGAIPHHARVYPLRNANGIVANAYIVAFEERSTGFDYQDIVFIVRNVIPASSTASTVEIAPSRLIFSDITGGAPSAPKAITINNTGDSPIEIYRLNLTAGTPFQITSPATLPSPASPLVVAAGGSVNVNVVYNPVVTKAPDFANITILSNSANPSVDVRLAGLSRAGNGGANEPSLQYILDTYEIPINVGDDNPATTAFHSDNNVARSLFVGDEVRIQLFEKAGPGPVTVEPIAVFGLAGNPPVRLGWYRSTSPDTPQTLLDISNVAGNHQTLDPVYTGSTSFDPGNLSFGMYTFWPPWNNRRIYQQDHLNTGFSDQGQPPIPHHMRIYPLKTTTGEIVPNAYVVAVEEYTAAFDFNDIVFIIRNVRQAPSAGNGIKIENLQWTGLLAQNIPQMEWVNRWVTFQRIHFPGSPPLHYADKQTVRIRNTSAAPLTVFNITITNNQGSLPIMRTPSSFVYETTAGQPVSFPINIPPGGFYDVQVRFILHLDDPNPATEQTEQKGTYFDTMSIFSSDITQPIANVTLAGAYMHRFEAMFEVFAQELADVFGYTMELDYPFSSLYEARGEEILSPIWEIMDPTKPIYARQLAALHGGGTPSMQLIRVDNTGNLGNLRHAPNHHQSLLPGLFENANAPAERLYTNTVAGGNRIPFYIQAAGGNHRSDRGLVQFLQGNPNLHALRLWPVRTPDGTLVPGAFYVIQDYVGSGCGSGSANCDFNDNVYLVTNIQPSNANSFGLTYHTDMTVRIFENSDPVLLGNELIYTVEAENLSYYMATDVQLSFNLPQNVNVIAVTPTQGTCNTNATVIACSFGNVMGEQKAVVQIRLNPIGGGIRNVSATVTTTRTETNPDNNFASESTVVLDPNNMPGQVTLFKDATPESPTPFPFTGDLGEFTMIDNGGGPSVVTKINFQNGLNPLAGYDIVDNGAAFGTYTGPQGRYGWRALNTGAPINATLNGVNRGSTLPVGQDQKTFMYMQYNDCCVNNPSGGVMQYVYWEYELPNGTYEVTVSVGDTASITSTHVLRAEGQVILGPFTPTTNNRFAVATATVVVNDGFLTIDSVGGTNTKINYVHISGGTPLNQRDFNFVTPGNYTIRENLPLQWQLDNVVCTGNSASVTVLDDGIILPVSSGDNIICTFNNSQIIGPSVDISMSPVAQQIPIGTDATFEVTVTNNGTVNLQNIQITDGLVPNCNANYASLAVGASQVYTCNAAEVMNDFTHFVEVSANPAGGGAAVTDSTSASVQAVNAGISIEKTTTTPNVEAGADVTFTIRLTNNSDVAVSNIVINDPLTPTCNLNLMTLAAGASQTYSCVQQDVMATFTNVVTATAQLQGGLTLMAEDSALVMVGTAPTLGVDPTSINFGSATVNSSTAGRSVALNNLGTGAIDVTNITITGTHSNQFSVAPNGNLGPDLTNNTEILNVVFSPTSAGIKYATLVITHNGSNSPVNIPLSGQGVPDDLPDLLFSESEVRFRVERATGAHSQTVELFTSGDTTNFTIDTTGKPAWLTSITPTTGVTDENPPHQAIQVNVNNTGMQPGTYIYRITAFANGYNSVTLPIVLEIIPVQYTITPSVSGEGGTISPAAAYEVNENSSTTLTLTPESTHYVDQVTVNGVPVTVNPNNTVTITSITEDKNVVATFIPKPVYSVNAIAQTGGTISPAGDNQVIEGESITFTVAAAVGYVINEVTIDDGSGPVPVSLDQNNRFTLSNVSSDYTILAKFTAVQTYAVFASTGGNGTISPSGEFVVNAGTSVSFTVVAAWQHELDKVLVNGAPIQTQGNTFNLTINQNTVIYATFRLMTTTCDPLTSLNCADIVVPVTYSQPYCPAWDGTDMGLRDGSFNQVPMGFTMVDRPSNNLFPAIPSNPSVPGFEPSNLRVDRFARTLRITSTKGIQYWNSANTTNTNSQVNALGVAFNARVGTVIEATYVNPVIPGSSGEQAGIWFGLNEDNYAKLVVTQNAGQPRIQLMVEVNGGRYPNGVGSPLTSNSTPPVSIEDKTVTLRMFIDPVTRRVTGNYSINGGTPIPMGVLDIPVSFTNGIMLKDNITGPVSFAGLFATHRNGVTPVEAVFSKFCIGRNQNLPTLNINATASFGGVISPAGDVAVAQGDSQPFVITPNNGYRIESVIVNGTPLANPTPLYTFNNVTTNHTIRANFAPIGTSYTITPSVTTPGGSISPASAIGVPQGSSATFNITPEVGYVINDVLVDGVSVGAVNSYTFSNVTADHSISASFNAVPTHTVTVNANAGGVITSPAGQFVGNVLTVNQGTDVVIDITSNLGFGIGQVVINGSVAPVQTRYEFPNIAQNYTMNVTFIPVNTYTITATHNDGGEVIPAQGTPAGGVLTINEGASVTYNIVPYQGYRITDVRVDGVSVGITTAYTFTNVTSNRTIEATFAPFTPGSLTIIKDAQPNSPQPFEVNVTSSIGMNQTVTLVDEGTPVQPYSVAINFDTSNQPLPAGFNMTDSGAAYGVNGEFGWRSLATNSPISALENPENRSFSSLAVNYPPEQRGFMYMQLGDCCINRPTGVKEAIYWEYALPNGIYNVTVSAGDVTSFANTTYLLRAEGVPVVGPFTPTDGNRFVTGTAQVVVADGRLTITPVGGTNNKINYIIIESVVVDVPNAAIFGNLQPATYTITENTLSDWSLQSLTCNAANQNIDLAAGTATISLQEGEQVICTLVNKGNLPPVQQVNTGMTIDENSLGNVITQAMLQYVDDDQTPAQLVYTLTSIPATGTLLLDGAALSVGNTFTQANINNGLLSFDHSGDPMPLSDSFSFSVTDGIVSTPPTGTFVITINPVNDEPEEVVNAGLTLLENTTATIGRTLLEYEDEEESAAELTYTVTTLPAEGTLSLTTFTQADINNGLLTYTHTGDRGSDSFTVSLTDGTNTLTGIVFQITIVEVNEPPELVTNTGITVDEGSQDNVITQAMLEATDREQGPAQVIYTITTAPVNGTLSRSTFSQTDINNGLLTYTHDGSETLSDSFAFSITDNVFGTVPVTGTFNITVNPVNDDPEIVNSSMNVDEGSEGNVITQANLLATDPDNTPDELRYIMTTAPAHGALFLNGTALAVNDEFTQADVNAGSVTYTHDNSETLSDQIIFTLTDQPAPENTGQTVTFVISVNPVNDPPSLAANTGMTVFENSLNNVITQAMLEYTDPDNIPATIIYTIVTPPSYGTLNLSSFSQGQINNGQVMYSHGGSEESTIDSFTFSVTDGIAPPQTGTFEITIILVNDPPEELVNNPLNLVVGAVNAPITDALLLYIDEEQTDPAELTYTVTTLPAEGTLSLTTFTQADINNGLLTYSSTGTVGMVDGFAFEVSDGENIVTGNFVINVLDDNDPPQLVTNTGMTVDEGSQNNPISPLVLEYSDEQGPADVIYIITALPENGTLTLAGVTLGLNDRFTQEDVDNNIVAYSHDGSETLADSFGFNVTDTVFGTTPTADTFAITVNPVDDPPVIDVNTGMTVDEGSMDNVIGTDVLSASDVDTPDAQLVFSITIAPVNGQLFVNGAQIVINGTFTQADLANGVVTYNHNGSQTLNDSFAFALTDGTSILNGTFAITVNPVNNPPVANNVRVTVPANESTDINVIANDTDADGTIDPATVTIVTGPANGTAVVNPDGTVTYTPDVDFSGQDSFTYTVKDNDGATSNEATVIITVTAVPNQPPVANDDFADAVAGVPRIINVLSNDTDVNGNIDPTTVTIVRSPANGTAVVNANGTVTYTANLNFSGQDSFTYTVKDSAGATSNEATVNILVSPSTAGPQVITNTGLSVRIGSARIITQAMLETTAPNNNADQLIYTLESAPANGTLSLNNRVLSAGGNFSQADINRGAVVYRHYGTATLQDAFTFKVSNDRAETATQTFNITITGVVSDNPNNLTVGGDLHGYPLLLTYGWIHMTDVNATGVPAQWYNIVVIRNGVEVVNIWVEASQVCDGVVCSVEYLDKTPPYIFDEGAYEWGVVAWSLDSNGNWTSSSSEVAVFTIGGAGSGGPGVEPITGIIVEPNQGRPTIHWDNDPNASWVQIYVGNDIVGMVYLEWIEKTDEICNGTRCHYTPDMNPYGGTYDVWMRSWGPNGFSTGGIQGWEGPVSFDLPTTPPAEITTLEVTNAHSGTPTFGWDGVANATWYQIWVGSNYGTNQEVMTYYFSWHLAAELGCENMGRCEITPQVTLPNGTNYQWAIQAWGPGGFSLGSLGSWTSIQTFNVNAEPAAVPVPGSPNSTTSLTEPHFTWQSSTDATWYEIWIGSGTDYTTYYQDWVSAAELNCSAAGSICMMDFGEVGFPAGEYAWALRAYTAAGMSDWSGVVNFRVD